MLFVVKNLQKRNGQWAYRKGIPKDVRSHFGGKIEWTHSLKGATEPQATQKASALNAEYDHRIKLVRGRINGIAAQKEFAEQYIEQNPDALDTTEPDFPGAPSPQSMHLEHLVDNYERYEEIRPGVFKSHIELPPNVKAAYDAIFNNGKFIPDTSKISQIHDFYVESHLKHEECKVTKIAVDSFVDCIGDKDLSALRRKDVKKWLDHLATAKGNKPETLKRRLGSLRRIVNYYIKELELDDLSNPFAKQELKSGHNESSRLGFNKAHLTIIANALTNSKASEATKCQIVLMRETGTGPSEIAGLRGQDVSLDAPIPYIWVRPNQNRGLKTALRDRKIPLLPEAVSALRKLKFESNAACIWGDFPDTNSLSAKLNKFIRGAGVPKSERLTAYSFRHTFKQALVDSGANDSIITELMGHARKGVTAKYGSPNSNLQNLAKAIESARELYGDVDDSVYDSAELLSKSAAT